MRYVVDCQALRAMAAELPRYPGDRLANALSRAAGISYGTAKNLLYGQVSDPRASTAMRIADALGCDLLDFMRWTD